MTSAIAAGVITVVCICGVVSSPSSMSVVFTAAAVAVVVVRTGSWCQLPVTSTRGGGFKQELLSLPHVHVETWFCQQKKRKNNHGCTFAPAVLVVPFCVCVIVHGGIGHVEWEGVCGGGCGETQDDV